MVKIDCMQCGNKHDVSIVDVFKDELGYGMQCNIVDGTCDISKEDFLKTIKEND